MRRGERIFKLVQRRISGSRVHGKYLVVGPTGLFLRSFRLFTTGRKNHNDLIGGITPLWRPLDEPTQQFGAPYGYSINREYWIITDPKDYGRSAEAVVELIAPHVERFQRIQTVGDFLAHFEFMRPHRAPDVRLDFAIADYLAGDLDRCAEGLAYVESLLEDTYGSTINDVRPILDRVRSKLPSDPAGLRDLIETWRLENIQRMGLAVD